MFYVVLLLLSVPVFIVVNAVLDGMGTVMFAPSPQAIRRATLHENRRTLFQRRNGWVERRTTIPTMCGRKIEFCEVRNTYQQTTQFALTSAGVEIWTSNSFPEADAVTWRSSLEAQLGGNLETVLAGLSCPEDARKILDVFWPRLP